MRRMSTVFSAAVVLLLACTLPSVLGHTYFDSVIINGVDRTDCMRAHPPSAKENPISLVSSLDMTCGFLPYSAQPAATKCPVAAGSQMSLQWWHTQPGDDVIASTHKGPCMVYLAKSETGAGNVWFKIYESGLDVPSQTWCVDTLIQNRGVLNVVIPANLEPGNYLMRGEIIALHNAGTIDGSQPYVGCAELTITGTGQALPTSLVSFPGAYLDTDPGLYPVSLYNGPVASYIIPGPPVWEGSATNPANPSASSATGSSTPSSPSTPASSTGSSSTPPSGGGSSTPSGTPSVSSAATCAAIQVSVNLRAGASWGNPAHNVYDISATNQGSSTITDLVVSITPDAGSDAIEETWNMVRIGTSNAYYVSHKVDPGQTYTSSGYILTGSATVKVVCPSGSSSPSSSSSSGSNTPAATTGAPAVTPPPPPPPPASPSTTGTSTPSSPSSGTTSASSSSSSPSSGTCRAGISFTLTNSWNNGGLVSIVISNTGSKSIQSVQVQVNVDSDSWNLLSSSTPRVYTLPAWGLPLAPGAKFDAAGYTFAGPQPSSGAILSVSC